MSDRKLRASLEKAIEDDRHQRLVRDITDAHDAEHEDSFDIYPDPLCLECRDLGWLNETESEDN